MKKFNKVTLTLALAVLVSTLISSSSSSSFAEDNLANIQENTQNELSELVINTSQISTEIDGQVIDNVNAKFPMFKHEGVLYYPTSWGTLKSVGFKKSKNYETGVLDIYKVDEKNIDSFEMAKEGKQVIELHLTKVDFEVQINGSMLQNGEYPVYENEKMVYIPLTYEVLTQLGWHISHRDDVVTVISSESFEVASARVKEVSDLSKVDYYDDLALYMMKINKRLPKEKADYYVELIKENSIKYGVDEIWIFSMMWLESNFDESCTTKGPYGHALGLMQIMDSTGRSLGLSWDQLLEPAISVEYAMIYLTRDLEYLKGDLELATIAYNQGITKVIRGTYNVNYLNWVLSRQKKVETFLAAQNDSRALVALNN